MTDRASSDVWRHQAAQWERFGPPMRPSPVDSDVLAGIVTGKGGPLRALVLGVTPEMARLPWPADTDLLAVDRSAEMIERVWPGWPGKGEGARQADWLDLDLAPGSRDLVVSDGCFGVIAHARHRPLLRIVRDVLAPGGRFAFRVFARPEGREEPAEVYAAARAGAIDSFHAFKLRLLMAVQRDTASGVVVGDVWDSWVAEGPSPEELSASRGWPVEQIRTLESYRGLDTVYCFPTLAELRGLFEAEGFDELACTVQSYELGERCPTLVLAPRTA